MPAFHVPDYKTAMHVRGIDLPKKEMYCTACGWLYRRHWFDPEAMPWADGTLAQCACGHDEQRGGKPLKGRR